MRTGECLDEFRIERLLGCGGMGAVYEASQASLNRSVALKILPDWLALDQHAFDRFQREAATAARLDHPNIVPIYAFGRSGGHPYFAMKLIRGLSLWELIQSERERRNEAKEAAKEVTKTELHVERDTSAMATPASDQSTRQFTPADERSFSVEGDQQAAAAKFPELTSKYRSERFHLACQVGQQCAKALDHAHRQGEIHRDIKPSNVMLDVHGHVYVIDFGLARAISYTASQHVCGTPRFMSPEQVSLAKLDGRTDIYSLGVTLYELVTAEAAFDAPDSEALAGKIRDGHFRPIQEIAPDVPPALAECIEKAMQARPSARYAKGEEFANALAQAEQLLDVQGEAASPARAIRPGTVRRKWWKAIAAAIVLVSVLGGSGWLLSSWLGGPDEEPGVVLLEDPLQIPPRVVLGDNRDLKNHSPISKQFEVATRPENKGTETLIGLGQPKSVPFKVEMTLAGLRSYEPELNWFHVGVFLGWKSSPAREGRDFSYQVIYFEYVGDAVPPPRQWVWRRLMQRGSVNSVNEIKDIKINPDHSIGFGQLNGREHRLVFTVRRSGLTELTLDGKPVPLLTSEMMNRRFGPDDFTGELGVCVRDGAVQVRDVRVTYLTEE